MLVDTGGPTNMPSFEVHGDWAELSAVAGAASCWVHNAVVATDGGEIIAFHAGQLVAFDTEGRLQGSGRRDRRSGCGTGRLPR
jgi:hypothetical protein